LQEFWVENPWNITAQGHNLSAYERNRVYLNARGRDFLEISHLTAADHEGDSRSVVAADFRNDGRLDLIVRQAGGGSVLLYENRFPRQNYLKVSLRGEKSNRQGIGARLVATINGQMLVREMYPANTYRSQGPNIVHLGLGSAKQIDRLTVHWPSGKVQEFPDVTANRHVVIDEYEEGDAAISAVHPGQTIRP
jgi:hypothetical protein